MFLSAVKGEPYPIPRYGDVPGVSGPYYGEAPSITPTVTYDVKVTKGGKTVTTRKTSQPIKADTTPESLPAAPAPSSWLDGEVYIAGQYWPRKRLALIAGGGILAAIILGALRK